MKGVIFNLLEAIVDRDLGPETWEALLDDTGLDGVYTSLGSYEDAELLALVGAASARLDKPPEEIVRWFGRNALPLLAERYPQLFEPYDEGRTFVLTLNEIIHPEVRKLYPGAITPEFDFDSSDPERLTMLYRSPRKLCALAEGLLEGTADFYDQSVVIEQPQCMNRGDEHCRMVIGFSR